jgi:hypothetical protein
LEHSQGNSVRHSKWRVTSYEGGNRIGSLFTLYRAKGGTHKQSRTADAFTHDGTQDTIVFASGDGKYVRHEKLSGRDWAR